jgi:hypothetical protein
LDLDLNLASHKFDECSQILQTNNTKLAIAGKKMEKDYNIEKNLLVTAKELYQIAIHGSEH